MTNPLEEILRQCAQATPNPWYPSAYAQVAGISRDSLDPPLEQLRLGGLIKLTDWVPVMGQGYVLTPEGVQALQNPRALERIREGQVPAVTPYVVQLPRSAPARTTTWDRGEAVRAALLGPSPFPAVTFGLILINVLVFLAGLALAQSWGVPINAYIAGGGNDKVYFIQRQIGFLNGEDFYLQDQWWRLLTACFGHIGLIHLGVNMYSLYVVGPLLERLWGSGRFLLLYLLSGVGGSCGMLLENPVMGGAGASGAIWGILASLATWLYLNRSALPPSLIADWRWRLLQVFLLNVIITFFIPNVSKGGHFGGGLVGLIAAVPADWIVLASPVRRFLGWLGLLAILLACLGLVAATYSPTRELVRLVLAVRDAEEYRRNQLIPLNGRPIKDLGSKKIQELRTELAEQQTRVRSRIQTAQRIRIWWNPLLERTRETGVDEGEKIIAEFDLLRRQLH